MASATVYAGSAGGTIHAWNAVYATARSGAGSLAVDPDTTYYRVGQTAPSDSDLWQTFVPFDLGVYAGASAVGSPVLALAPNAGDHSTTDFVIRARDVAWGPTLTTADWVAGASLGATGSLRCHYDTAGGWIPNGTYIPLTDDALAAAITSALGGTLYLVLYSSRTEAGTAPSVNEYVYFGGHDDPFPPRLTFTYTPPVAGAGDTAAFIGGGFFP